MYSSHRALCEMLNTNTNTNTEYSMKMLRKALWFCFDIVYIHFLCASYWNLPRTFNNDVPALFDFNRLLHSLLLLSLLFVFFSVSFILTSSFSFLLYIFHFHGDNKIFKWHYKLFHSKHALTREKERKRKRENDKQHYLKSHFMSALLFDVNVFTFTCLNIIVPNDIRKRSGAHIKCVQCMVVSWWHDALRKRTLIEKFVIATTMTN